jgi:hypothetical protein
MLVKNSILMKKVQLVKRTEMRVQEMPDSCMLECG